MTQKKEIQLVINYITQLDMKAGAQLMIDVFDANVPRNYAPCRQCKTKSTSFVYCVECRPLYVEAFMAIFRSMTK